VWAASVRPFWYDELCTVEKFYGARFWAPASLVRTANTYALFLKTFAPIAIAIVAVLAIISLRGSLWGGEDDAGDASLQERWLAVGLLALPVVGYAATKVAHGGLAERYVLPMVLGLPLGLAWMLTQFGRKAVALFASLVLIAVTLQEGFFLEGRKRHIWQSCFADGRRRASGGLGAQPAGPPDCCVRWARLCPVGLLRFAGLGEALCVGR
jgi:hypothetical protein